MIPTRLPRLASGLLAAAAVALVASVAPPSAAQATNQLSYYAQTAIKDFSGRTRVISKNDRELKKLGDGFVRAYQTGTQRFFYKEPGKVRLEGKQGLATVRLVTNGDQRIAEYRVPPGLKKTDRSDLKEDPGKGDYCIDFGVITPSFARRVQAKFLRYETRDGKRAAVFTFQHPGDKKADHTVVLDPETRLVLDHISHHRNKKLPGFKSRYVFSLPQKFGSVWLPTRVELRNAENKTAGVSAVEQITVNTGLQEALFAL